MVDCTISGNTALIGGGIYFGRGKASLQSCTISGNTGVNGYYGGGIQNYDSMTLTDCIVQENAVTPVVPGFETTGGGGISNSGVLTLNGCSIRGNRVSDSTGGGGGIRNTNDLTLNNCTIEGNRASGPGSGGGGGIWNSQSVVLNACTVRANTTDTRGGGIITTNSITLQNGTTFTENQAGGNGGAMHIDHAGTQTSTIDASSLSGNVAQGSGGGGSSIAHGDVTLRNGSAVSGNTAVTGEWG